MKYFQIASPEWAIPSPLCEQEELVPTLRVGMPSSAPRPHFSAIEEVLGEHPTKPDRTSCRVLCEHLLDYGIKSTQSVQDGIPTRERGNE